jgi:hypothetical protein
MNKEFVPYEQALELKELGFDEPCFGYYNVSNQELIEDLSNNRTGNDDSRWASAPLYQQAFRFFREKYDKYGVVNIDFFYLSNNLEDKIFVYMIEDKLGYIIDRSEEYNTYEEAEFECLNKLIEIVKNA